MGSMPYEKAAPQYAQWLADLKEYLRRMEVPDHLYTTLIASVDSVEMRMLTNNEILPLINHATIDEWLTNRCGQMTFRENKELGELSYAKMQRQYYNQTRYQQLYEKSITIMNCRTAAHKEARYAAFKKMFGP